MGTRLENTTGGSNKFWTIELDGSKTTSHFGKIGSKGQNVTKDHGSDEKAKKFHDAQIEKKKKEGYVDAKHPEGEQAEHESSDEGEVEPPAKKLKLDESFKFDEDIFFDGVSITVIGKKFEHGLTLALAKQAAKAAKVKFISPAHYENADIIVKLNDGVADPFFLRFGTVWTEEEFMKKTGLH